MRPMRDSPEAQPEPATREPLVDLDIHSGRPDESPTDSRSGRRRLSVTEPEENTAPPVPQAKPSGRPTLSLSEPPAASPSKSQPQRPSPADRAQASQTPELRPRAARPRIAMTLASEEMPGLQNIIDPPHSGSNGPASGHTSAESLPGAAGTRQNLALALVGGLIAAAVGAAAWAFFAQATGYQSGGMAVGVGLLVGGGVRVLGRGADRSFGYLGVIVSLFGCIVGSLLSLCMAVAGQKGLAPLAVLSQVYSDPAMIPAALLANFRSLDLLFYGIALYAGYRLSFRHVTEAA